MATFIDYGLESWQRYFVESNDDETRIFAICTPGACEKLVTMMNEKNNVSRKPWSSLVPVPESLFPFTLETVGKHMWANKFTWIFQQLLKLYSYQVLSKLEPHPVKRRYLVIDSDTVAVRRTQFLHDDKPVYNIASESSGAYFNDCNLGPALLREVFPDGSVPEAVPDFNGQKFTSISHQMMIDGEILEEMIDAIVKANNAMPAWQKLRKLKSSVLSEWEAS